MNREARRAMAARARDVALRLARTAMDYDPAGRVVRVSDGRAQAALAQAYERMLRAGGVPQVLRVSNDVASAFPRGRRRPEAAASAWLAVGVDSAGLGTYVLRWLPDGAVGPAGQRALAEAVLLAALSIECSRPGFPVAGHA